MEVPIESILMLLHAVTGCKRFRLMKLLELLEQLRREGFKVPESRCLSYVLPFMELAGLTRLVDASSEKVLELCDLASIYRIGRVLDDPLMKLIDRETYLAFQRLKNHVQERREELCRELCHS